MNRRGIFSIVVVMVISGCIVQLGNNSPNGCDDTHLCVTGQTCVNAQCVDTASAVDAGISWAQGPHGFGRQQMCDAGCVLQVDASQRNLLSATVDASKPDSFLAVGQVTESNLLPQRSRGKLSGWIRFSSGGTPLSFVRLDTTLGQSIVRLWLEPDRRVAFLSEAELLSAQESLDFVYAGLAREPFQIDKDYFFELAWERGRFRSLAVNGQTVLLESFSTDPAREAVPSQLSLGATAYTGIGPSGTTVLWDWTLGDNPFAPSTFSRSVGND